MIQYQSILLGQTQEIQCFFASSECLCAYGMCTEILHILINKKNILKSFIFLSFWDHSYNIHLFPLLSSNTLLNFDLFPVKFVASVSLPLHVYIHTNVFLYITWSVCTLALYVYFQAWTSGIERTIIMLFPTEDY